MKKQSMFENYPDVVEVDDLRKMLGGISKKLAYRLLSDQEIRSVRVGRTYKIPKICVIEYLMGEEMCHINLLKPTNLPVPSSDNVEKSSAFSTFKV